MKNLNIERIFMMSIVLLFSLAFLLISGCGRDNYGPTESMTSENYDSSEIIHDIPELDESVPMTSEEALKAKKMKQFFKNDADTSVMTDDDIKNILIVGQDRRAGDKTEMRSDSMMIFSINTLTNQINLVSLMRDMYIPCADGKEGMINLTYLNGGAKLLSQTIEMNFGIHIDNYIETDFWRFMDLMDTIGLVDVELSFEEAGYINDMSKNYRVAHYDYGDTEPAWYLHGGVNPLDPEQILSFCRVRQDIGGDWGRTDRQRRAIIAIFNKLNNMSYAGLIRTIKEGGKYLSTDMDVGDMENVGDIGDRSCCVGQQLFSFALAGPAQYRFNWF